MKRRKTKSKPKIDLNSYDKKEVEKMIFSYKQEKMKEVPLRINKKLVIMVCPENCNERYRQKYIKQHQQYEK